MRKSLVLVFAMLLLTGCLGGVFSTPGGDSTLRLFLTDAPINGVEEVVVTIKEVQVSGGPGGNQTIGAFPEGKAIDLLTLRFSDLELGEKELPAGNYKQLRLILSNEDGANYVRQDGVNHPLKVPSGPQTGLKINHDFALIPNGYTELVIDVNIVEFLRATGKNSSDKEKNHDYLLPPRSVRVVERLIAGDVEGWVGKQVDDALVPVEDRDLYLGLFESEVATEPYSETLALRVAAEDRIPGDYRFNAVESGTYYLKAYLLDDNGDRQFVGEYGSEITVEAGEVTILQDLAVVIE